MKLRMLGAGLGAVLSLAALSGAAHGQAAFSAAFVANNGNLEGSVTTYRINGDGTVSFVAKFVTGSVPNSQSFDAGTNATSISVTPNGRYLAVGHGTSSDTVERISLLRVNADGTLTLAHNATTPDSPLDLDWIDNETLAVTRTALTSAQNQVLVYRWNPATPSLTILDTESNPGFTTDLVLDPLRRFLYAQESTGNTIRSYTIHADGTLSFAGVAGAGMFPLGPGVTPDGKRIYYGGGISAGGVVVGGMDIDLGSGGLSVIATGPWATGGSSPKQVVFSRQGDYAYAAHGTDATIRALAIDGPTGNLVPTGASYDIGFQGSLGDVATLGDLLFAPDRDTISDGVRGLRSLRMNADGSITPQGGIVDSQGTTPTAVAPWRHCPGDVDGDGTVAFADLNGLLDLYGQVAGPGILPPDFDFDGTVGFGDLNILLDNYGQTCLP